jgi:HlyD family secretion protein
VIVVLDAAELQARRDQLAAQLAEAEAGPRKEEIAAAKADWEAQSAQQNLANLERQRAAELVQDKTVSASEYDRAVATARRPECRGGQGRYDLLLAGTTRTHHADPRPTGRTGNPGARDRSSRPAACRVRAKTGDVLAPNQAVATLLLTNHIWVRVYALEPWLGHIKLGDAVQVRVDSFPAKDFAGTVEQIQRSAEFTPRNVQTVGERVKQVFGVKVRLDNSEGQLRAGMAADVLFPNAPR